MKKLLSLMLSKVLLNLSKSDRIQNNNVTEEMRAIQEMIFWLNDLSYRKMEELLAKKELLNADVKLATQELNRLKSSIETLTTEKNKLKEANRGLVADRYEVQDQIFDLKKQIAELNVPQPPNPPQEDNESQLPVTNCSVKDLFRVKYELTPEETLKINQSTVLLDESN